MVRFWSFYNLKLPDFWQNSKTKTHCNHIEVFTMKAGYEIVPGGKGSHWKLKKEGRPTVIIPDHKELKAGTEHALRKLLDMAQ